MLYITVAVFVLQILSAAFVPDYKRSAGRYRGVRTTSPHQFLANRYINPITIRLSYVLYITVLTVFVLQILPTFVPD